MKGSSFGYLCKEGLRSVWTNRLMALASMGILTTCLLLIGCAVLLSLNVEAMVRYVEQQSDMVVIVKDEAKDQEIKALENKLKGYDGVVNVQYISKEQALKNRIEQFGDQGDLLEGLVNDNPLPASFNVTIEDLGNLDNTIQSIESNKAVEYVRAPTNIADTLVGFRKMINTVSSIVVVALILVSLVIVSNTIRASVFSRRTEIGIMRYVGATNTFIRIPFFIEGIVLGLLSAGIAYLLIWAGYQQIVEIISSQYNNAFLSSLFSGSILPFESLSYTVAFCFLVAGPATGALGCISSLRKHLKV